MTNNFRTDTFDDSPIIVHLACWLGGRAEHKIANAKNNKRKRKNKIR